MGSKYLLPVDTKFWSPIANKIWWIGSTSTVRIQLSNCTISWARSLERTCVHGHRRFLPQSFILPYNQFHSSIVCLIHSIIALAPLCSAHLCAPLFTAGLRARYALQKCAHVSGGVPVPLAWLQLARVPISSVPLVSVTPVWFPFQLNLSSRI